MPSAINTLSAAPSPAVDRAEARDHQPRARTITPTPSSPPAMTEPAEHRAHQAEQRRVGRGAAVGQQQRAEARADERAGDEARERQRADDEARREPCNAMSSANADDDPVDARHGAEATGSLGAE